MGTSVFMVQCLTLSVDQLLIRRNLVEMATLSAQSLTRSISSTNFSLYLLRLSYSTYPGEPHTL